MRREHMTPKQELAFDRAEIMRTANPVKFLADIMNGKPVAIRDWEGGIIRWEEADMNHRVVAAKELLGRVVPTLKAVDVNEQSGAVSVTFVSPIPLPNGTTADTMSLASPGDLGDQIENAVILEEDDDE